MTPPPFAPVRIRDTLRLAVATAAATAAGSRGWGLAGLVDGSIERPRNPAHGDFSSNAALLMARRVGYPAVVIARAIAAHLPTDGPIASATVAPPGFINVTLADDWLVDQLAPWLQGALRSPGQTALGDCRTLGDARCEATAAALLAARRTLDREEDPGVLRARLASMAPALAHVELLEDGVALPPERAPGWPEIAQAVGADLMTFSLLMRPIGAALALDLASLRREAADNPAYYACYTYTRIAAILRLAGEQDMTPTPAAMLEALHRHPAGLEERALLFRLVGYGDVLSAVVDTDEPYRVTQFLSLVSADFHRFYAAVRVFGDLGEPSVARLGLIHGAAAVMRHAMSVLLGRSPRETLDVKAQL